MHIGKVYGISGSWTMNGNNTCFLFSRFFAILTKLNANDTCVEAPLRQAVGTTSVLAAVRTIGGIYMFGRVMPVWSVVLVEFCFAFFTQLFFIQPFVRTVFKLIFAGDIKK